MKIPSSEADTLFQKMLQQTWGNGIDGSKTSIHYGSPTPCTAVQPTVKFPKSHPFWQTSLHELKDKSGCQ